MAAQAMTLKIRNRSLPPLDSALDLPRPLSNKPCSIVWSLTRSNVGIETARCFTPMRINKRTWSISAVKTNIKPISDSGYSNRSHRTNWRLRRSTKKLRCITGARTGDLGTHGGERHSALKIFLTATNWDCLRSGLFEGVSFTLSGGENLGLGGLIGSGRTGIAEVLFGVGRPPSGMVGCAPARSGVARL